MTDELGERVSVPKKKKIDWGYQRTVFPDPADHIGDYQQWQKKKGKEMC